MGQGDNAQALARRALRRIVQNKLPPTPEVYAVFYYEADGSHPELNKEIAALEAAGRLVDPLAVSMLHEQHLGAGRSLERTDAALRNVEGLLDAIVSALQNPETGPARLEEAKAAIERTMAGQPGVSPKLRESVTALIQYSRGLAEGQQRALDHAKDGQQDVGRLRRELDDQAKRSGLDALTGLASRGVLERAIAEYLENERTRRELIAVIIAGIDQLEKSEDLLGPRAGDDILQNVAAVMKAVLGKQAVLARFDEDKFAAVLVGASKDATVALVHEFRAALRTVNKAGARQGSQFKSVTLSLGVTFARPGETMEKLMARAGQALHSARAFGSDRAAIVD